MNYIKTLIVALICVACYGCSPNKGSATDVAKGAIESLNHHEYEKLWSFISDSSKAKLKKQLTENRKSMVGRSLMGQFNISDDSMDSLTVYEYFVAIMSYAAKVTPKENWESTFEKIDIKDTSAIVTWSKINGTSGETNLIKENGIWKLEMTF